VQLSFDYGDLDSGTCFDPDEGREGSPVCPVQAGSPERWLLGDPAVSVGRGPAANDRCGFARAPDVTKVTI
jgi:hypothetical protein